MSKSKLITVLSDKHQKEYDCLYYASIYEDLGVSYLLIPAVVSRMAWLEYQAKLKVESILELCRTGK